VLILDGVLLPWQYAGQAQREFEQMLTAGDVTDVSLVNDRQVECTAKKEALQKPEYSRRLVAQRVPGAAVSGPQFVPGG
jgi:cell division protease FtsH